MCAAQNPFKAHPSGKRRPAEADVEDFRHAGLTPRIAALAPPTRLIALQATWPKRNRILPLLFEHGLHYNKGDNASGTQTERRGGAGPVRGLLGGKDLTGRFFVFVYGSCAIGA